MKMNYLFPHRFKKFGWIVFIPVLLFLIPIFSNEELYGGLFSPSMNFYVLAIVNDDFLSSGIQFFKVIQNNISDELIFCLLVLSGILVGFSKVKIEDEMVSKIRLESLVWATYVNYAILFVAILFIYGTIFLKLLYINIFSLLFFFIIRFHWKLYQYNKMSIDEE
ncbi:hypothetical protein [Flavobacterium undicola]|uniref:hypothetical protein n=1 Tax=Flavobacterium undicola TaxID=1932779 RepID=UPI0013774653|nr:hypothetical protein [Flavobacterium undicola]MBA0882224.1 hypothetical protein [Flavobacterium undicola]